MLDFGIVLVGSTAERELTVKNQGVTTVTLEVPNTTQNTASPFRVMLESPLVLSPSESKEVPVRINPTTSGLLSGDVQLTSGSNKISVFIRARALTYEEYLQALLNIYNAFNTAPSDEPYGIAYVKHPQYAFDLLLAGLKDLTKEKIEQLYAEVSQYNVNNVNHTAVNPQFIEALRLLSIIDLQKLIDWITTLVQALAEGRFDEEYERLLLQGLDQFEQVVILTQGLQDREAAKASIYEAIYTVIVEQPGPSEQGQVAASTIFQLLLEALLHHFVQFIDTEMVSVTLLSFKMEYDKIVGLLINQNMGSELMRFTMSLYIIGMHIISGFFPNPDPTSLPTQQGVNSWTQFLNLKGFLYWVTSSTGGFYAPTPRDRLEQGLGALYTAAALIGKVDQQGRPQNEWVFVAFRSLESGWIGLIMLLPPEKAQLGDGRGLLAVIRGDNCSECAGKAKVIAEWVSRALRDLPVLRNQLMNDKFWSQFTERGFMEIIILTFTRPGAQGVNTVITSLRNNQTIRNSETPIMVLSFDENGNVQFQCISVGCENLQQNHPELIDKIKQAFGRALALAMAAYPGLSPALAWHLAFGICGGDLDCILWLAEEIAKELGGSGGDANCQKMKLHPLLRLKPLRPC